MPLSLPVSLSLSCQASPELPTSLKILTIKVHMHSFNEKMAKIVIFHPIFPPNYLPKTAVHDQQGVSRVMLRAPCNVSKLVL